MVDSSELFKGFLGLIVDVLKNTYLLMGLVVL